MNAETRKEMELEHYQKWEDIAQAIGISRLTRLVPLVGYNTLAEAYKADKNLNNIPLQSWDIKDFSVRHLLGFNQKKIAKVFHKYANYAPEHQDKVYWSLSDTVCVLKHVAIYHFLGNEPPKA